MSGYTKSLDETDCMSFLMKTMNCWKNMIKSGLKSVIVLKRI